MFAPGLMKFDSTCAGVVLYTMLIHRISCVTTNTAVSLLSESILWFSDVNSFFSNEFFHELHETISSVNIHLSYRRLS